MIRFKGWSDTLSAYINNNKPFKNGKKRCRDKQMSIITKHWNKAGLFATQGSTGILGIDIHRARHARARHT